MGESESESDDKSKNKKRYHFLEELLRRRVHRAGLSYLVIAWLIVQVIAVVGPALGLGDGIMRISLLVLSLGFPIALILSWFFNIGSDGVHVERVTDDAQIETSYYRGRNVDFIIIGVLVAALLVSLFFRTDKADVEVANNILAILPLTNLSASTEDANFVDGLHDDLLTTLSRINALEVISRTSVMGFRNTTESISQISQKLGADKIIEGSVQRAGEMIRVNVQLIDAKTDTHIWADIFERNYSAQQVFRIQSEIARAVARELRIALSLQDNSRLDRVPTIDTEAYRLYLLAKQRIAERTSESLAEAVGYLKQAIDLDSRYAEAYTALALAYTLQHNYSGVELSNMLQLAMPTVQYALELNPDSEDAHTILADLRYLQGDVQGAETAYQRSLELNPNSALTRHWYGIMLLDSARYEEALVQHRAAQRLDPLSPIISLNVAQDMLYLGDRAGAQAEYEKTLAAHPSFVPTYAHLAALYSYSFARPDKAVQLLNAAAELDPGHTEYPSQLAEALLDLGQPAVSRPWVDVAMSISDYKYWPLRANLLYAVYTNDVAAIDDASDQMLAIVPRQYTALKFKLHTLVSDNQVDEAKQMLRAVAPQLFENPPQIENSTWMYALLLAHLEREAGNQTLSYQLAQSTLNVMEGKTRIGLGGIEIYDAEAWMLLDQPDRAIAVIEQAVSEDWSHNWWMMRVNPIFRPLKEHPKFVAVINYFESRMDQLSQQMDTPEDLQ